MVILGFDEATVVLDHAGSSALNLSWVLDGRQGLLLGQFSFGHVHIERLSKLVLLLIFHARYTLDCLVMVLPYSRVGRLLLSGDLLVVFPGILALVGVEACESGPLRTLWQTLSPFL